jgi:excisionase family DNA binding protein
MTPAMLTVGEAAAYLRITRGSAYSLLRQGLLPSVRIGRQIRVSEAALADFIVNGGRAWPGGWRKGSAEPAK